MGFVQFLLDAGKVLALLFILYAAFGFLREMGFLGYCQKEKKMRQIDAYTDESNLRLMRHRLDSDLKIDYPEDVEET